MCGVKECLGCCPSWRDEWQRSVVYRRLVYSEEKYRRTPLLIEATEEIEEGFVIGYTVTVPECPGNTAYCEKPDEIIPTGTALMKNIKE